MLRNECDCLIPCAQVNILNEVLSLNAQEYAKGPYSQVKEWFLNEVLSLNAQEFHTSRISVHVVVSSMKS